MTMQILKYYEYIYVEYQAELGIQFDLIISTKNQSMEFRKLQTCGAKL